MNIIILIVVFLSVSLYLRSTIYSKHNINHSNENISKCNINSLNCVSSLSSSDDNTFVDKIKYDGNNFHEDIKKIIESGFNSKLIYSNNNYIHFEITTKIMRYKDDLELKLDGNLIHVSSKSRVGKSDLGANRKRVEKLRVLVEKM